MTEPEEQLLKRIEDMIKDGTFRLKLFDRRDPINNVLESLQNMTDSGLIEDYFPTSLSVSVKLPGTVKEIQITASIGGLND